MIKNSAVSDYYDGAPTKFQNALNMIRATIFMSLANEPEMSEVYSYRIAVYKYGNKPLFSVAYFKDHCSFITQDKQIVLKLPELQKYNISGTSIHFTNENPLVEGLVKKIISQRLKDRKHPLKG